MSNSSQLRTILHKPDEINEEQQRRKIIDDILGDINADNIVDTLNTVNRNAKAEGIDSSYEGNRMADEGISKILSEIEVNTNVKEEIVITGHELKVDNLYEHYLLQSRLCNVPIEVFLGTEVDAYQPQATPTGEDFIPRVDVGEPYQDYSQNFKGLKNLERDEIIEPTQEEIDLGEDEVLINFEEEPVDEPTAPQQEEDLNLTAMYNAEMTEEILPVEDDELILPVEEDEVILPVEEELTLENQLPVEELAVEEELVVEEDEVLFPLEEELPLEDDEVILPFEEEILPQEEVVEQPVVFTEEVVTEDAPTEKVILGEEFQDKTPEVDFQLQDDVTRLMQGVGLDIKPVQPVGTGISKTYSLEELKTVTGGSSEI